MADKDKIDQEEVPEVYLIPDNFTNSGKIFQGMFEFRNIMEAAAICIPVGFIEYQILFSLLPMATAIIIMIITLAPLLILSVFGINGDSLSQFAMCFFNFMKNKRKLRYRRIVKNATTSTSRAKSRPSNSKKKSTRK